MKIDIYAHILTPRFKRALYEINGGPIPTVESLPTLFDIDLRRRLMEKHEVRQVLVPSWAHGVRVSPRQQAELMKFFNDEMAELIQKYPDSFVSAAAFLPTLDIDAALREAERSVKELGLGGVLLQNPVNGRPMDSPEFFPLYRMMSDFDLPIWIHPSRPATVPDYENEAGSQYYIWMTWGWPYDTTVAMTRLVFSGVLDKYPNLKFITHHCGSMTSFFAERIAGMYDFAEACHNQTFKEPLAKQPVEYFRMFYNDTALYGNTPALMCAYAFFGPEHILFGTDMPYDNEDGNRYTRETIRSINELQIPEAEKKFIFQTNAEKLLHLPRND